MLKITTRGAGPILADLRRIVARIEAPFTDPAPIQTIIADAILLNMEQECDPDGLPWPELSEGYATWKETVAPGAPMGELFGAMKELENLRGVAIDAGLQLTITYGVDPVAIEHAIKFTEGGILTGTSQPPRPFFGITAAAEALLTAHFDTLFRI